MASSYRPVREIVARIVDQSLKPLAHSAGFKRQGFNFRRRSNDLIQVVNVQLSRGNSGSSGGFYLNIGIAFDKLAELEGKPVNERVPEYDCHFRRRIRDFCPDAPDRWNVDLTTDINTTAFTLAENFKTVLLELEGITSIPSFLAQDILHQDADFGLLARLQYAVGNMRAARETLQHESELFADRQGMSVQELVTRYKLTGLEIV